MTSEAPQPKKARTALPKSSTIAASDPGSTEWFTYKRYPSDVTLKFDDKHRLYVSKEFLMYSSPVFEAMFTHEMKEKRTGTVELKCKSYTDFLELLLCIHPRVCKPITKCRVQFIDVHRVNHSASNVHSLALHAIEYQIQPLLERCKTVLRIWMKKGTLVKNSDFQPVIPEEPERKRCITYYGTRFTDSTPENHDPEVRANFMLKTLQIANIMDDSSFWSETISMFENISHCYVDGSVASSIRKNILQENKHLFSSLEERVKTLVYKTRLKKLDTPVNTF